MSARRWPATVGRAGAALLALCALAVPARMAAQSICAAAKIELGQEAALEREGFVATLAMTNNLADQALTGLRIELVVKDAGGASSESAFFANLTSLDGTTAIDGTGTIQPSASAKARWLIVPSPGAGGTAPAGVRYTVQARMSMQTGGVPRVVTTFPVAITVKPQPLLKLEYALPFEVFGDEPMTEVRESTVPFPLGLRVSNVGAGTARNFQVQSNQPLITDNAQGLAVDFDLLGTWLGAEALPENTLLIPFGDVAPGAAKQAAWSMTSSLSGRFVDFTSTFTHAAELGGALTSLIASVTTYTLIKDVIVDLPGRDAQFDFLVNVTTPRSQLEEDLRLGREPKPEFLMESDRPGLAPVADVPGRLTGALSGAGSILRLAYDVPVGSNAWVHCAVPAPNEGAAPLVSVSRADGKVVSPRNAWVSKHFDKESRRYSYFLHVLDYTGETQSDFAMAFDAANLDSAPDAVADLSAASDGAGALLLRWTATGEDGSSGTVFGGRYSIFVTTDPIVAPSAAAAQVSFATSTPAGAAQSYRITGLQGNASYYVTVYLADGAGQVSAASNRASALTGAHAPGAALVSEVSAEGFTVSWDGSANRAGTEYRVLLSSAGGPISDSGYAEGRLSASFTGLSPNASYFVSASARDQSGLETALAPLATAVTRALPPGPASPAFVSVTTSSLTAVWLRAGNPEGTEFQAELSTSADHEPPFASSAWLAAESAQFAGLAETTTYYGRVKARDRAGVETAWLELGAERTTSSDQLPPRTSLTAGSPSHGADPLWIGSTTTLSLLAADDSREAGDGLGVGVAATYLAVDGGSFTVVAGTFSLVVPGVHTLAFYSVDQRGNEESVAVSTVAVDDQAPVVGLSLAEAAVVTATATLAATFSDSGVGVDSASVRLAIDGLDVTAQAVVSSSQALLSLGSAGDGQHSLQLVVGDRLGRQASVVRAFVVDSVAPVVLFSSPTPAYTPAPSATISAEFRDLTSGVDLRTLKVTLDGVKVAPRIFHAAGGGAPSPWQLTTPLPVGRQSAAVAAYGGHIYVMGGLLTGASNPTRTVIRAAILPDKTLGPWQTAPQLPRDVEGASAVLVEDRIYVMGGFTTANGASPRFGNAGVYWTRVQSDGSLAPWAEAAGLPFNASTQFAGAAAVAGWIYVAGGERTGDQSYNNVFFAKSCATGLCGSWAAGPNLPTTLSRFDMVGFDDCLHLYTAGGDSMSGWPQTPTQSVYHATVNLATGQLSSWSQTVPLPVPTENHTFLGDRRNLYVLGGATTAWGAAMDNVFHGMLGSDHALAAWSSGTTYALRLPSQYAAGAVWNGALYLVGGMAPNGAIRSEVQYSSLDFSPVTAASAAYTASGLAEGTHSLAGEAVDMAGNKGSGSASFGVDMTAPLLRMTLDGRTVPGVLFSSATRPTVLLSATDALSGVASSSYRLWLDGVERTAELAGATWQPAAELAQGRHVLESYVTDGVGNATRMEGSYVLDAAGPKVILTPGHESVVSSSSPLISAALRDDASGVEPLALQVRVDGATVPVSVVHDGGGLGAPGPWTEVNPMSRGYDGPALVAISSYLFALGGRVVSGGQSYASFDVRRSSILPDGTIGPWATLPYMPNGRYYHRAVTVADRIYVIGGITDTGPAPVKNGHWTRVLPDGSLAAWQQIPYLVEQPGGMDYFGAAAVGEYVFVAGGENRGCSTHVNVFRGRSCPQTGICGGWTVVGQLPRPTTRFDMTVVEGDLHVYIPGGSLGGCTDNVTDSVYHASVDPVTGALGAWQQTTRLPSPRDGNVTLAHERNLYVIAGSLGASGLTGSVVHGRLGPDHEVLSWSSSPAYALPRALNNADGAVWNGRLYVAGGAGADGVPLANVYMSPVDGGLPRSATATVAALHLADGNHTLFASAKDGAGALSSATVTFLVDATPPASMVEALGSSRSYAGVLYGRTTDWLLSAEDPVPGSGLARRLVSIDGAAFEEAGGPFTLAQGVHDISFYSEDLAGNREEAKTARVVADLMPPAAVLDLAFVDRATDTLRVAWTSPGDDGPSGTIASGLALIQRSAGEPAFSTSSAQVAVVLESREPGPTVLDLAGLQPGTTYSIALWTRDTAGNDSPMSNVLVAQTMAISQSIDGVATLVSPLAQLHVATVAAAEQPGAYTVATTEQGLKLLTTGFYELEGGPVVFTDTATLTFVFDPSGVDLQQVAIYRWNGVYWDSAPVSSQLLTLLPNGFYEIEGILATTSLYGVFERLDIRAPRTTLAVGEPRAEGPGRFFVTSVSPLSLTSLDDLLAEGDGVGLGVAVQELSVGGSTRAFVNALPARAQPFSSSFTVTGEDGVYPLSFFARDLFGNRETTRVIEVELDNAAPSSDLAVSGPLASAASTGTFYASTSTVFALSARDAGSGVALTEFSDGGGTFQASTEPFGLAEGVHALLYRSADRIGNLEVARSTAVLVDAGAPVSTAAVGGPLFVSTDGALYGSTATVVSLSAADPEIPGAPGSGVAGLLAEIDGASAVGYTAPLRFSSGSHGVVFHAEDRVGNAEAPQVLSLRVDGLAPETSLVVGAPRLEREGPPTVVGPTTPLSLSSADPGEPASGVAGVSFRLGAQPFLAYSAPFTVAGPDGFRVVEWSAADNVGNAEQLRSGVVALDATAPVTTLAMLSGRQHSDGVSFYASSTTLFVLPALDPVVEGVASGVESTEVRDNEGSYQPSTAAFALSEGVHALGYRSRDRVLNLEVERSTTILVDATSPATLASVGSPSYAAADGALYVSPASLISLSASDPALPGGAAGSGVAGVDVSVDGGAFAPYASALALAQGLHLVSYHAVDRVGNAEASQSLAVRSDGTPPVSALLVGQPSRELPTGAVLVASTTLVSITAHDPVAAGVAAGVKGTFLRVLEQRASTAAFAAYAAPFALGGADGTMTVELYSEDEVLNTEAVQARTLVLDSRAPVLALRAGGAGLASVVAGLVELEGEARDEHLLEYRLEAAPGQGVVQGFRLVAVGTSSASGVLGVWDASTLSGWYTLRLSAVDLVGNASEVTASVFVGEPARVLVLGDHKTFTMPEAVAADGEGRIYAADTGADRVLVFSSTGALLSALGDGSGKKSLALNKPRGVAVGEDGSLFVADAGHGRVVKLSPEGELLLEVAGLKRPAGVALGPDGRIVVADSGARVLKIFDSTGTLTLTVAMPPGPEEADDDPRPWGVAVDAAGRLYAADPPGGRAILFDPAGTLLRIIPVPAGAGGEARPHGVAVSAGGDALFVSERQSGRVFRFDAQGRQTLSFGRHGKIKDGKALPEPIVFNKPMGLWLASDGGLYVADRNNDRVQLLSAPTGAAALVVPPSGSAEDYDEVAADVLDTEEGGSVARSDKAGVEIPAGALSRDTKISVAAASPSSESDRREKAEEAGLKPVSAPVEFAPHGTLFDKPVTLTLPYSEELLRAQNASPKALAVAYWNDEAKAWEPMESEVDAHNKTVSAKTKHFSLYQVLGSTGGATGPAVAPAADESFVFRDLYVYPNPARGGAVPRFHLAVGVADKVSLRVYDAAGREIHRATLDGRPPVIDDGSGAKYAYEHAWEGRIASGVYLFVVEAEKNGFAPIRKAGRFAVVR